MWKAKTGETVDGVIAIDPIGLQALIEVSGPVMVDGKLITKDNVVREILLQSYLDYESEPGRPELRCRTHPGPPRAGERHRPGDRRPARRQGLGRRQPGRGPPEARPRAATSSPGRRSPSSSAAGRRPGSPAGSARTPCSLALQNRVGNKLDQFIAVSALLEHRPVSGGSEVTVSIHIENQTPTEGLNSFVEGPYPFTDFTAGEYSGILSVNIPGVSRTISLDGGTKLVAAGPDGPTRVIGTEMPLLRGEKKDYLLKFTVPTGYEHVTIEPSARYPSVTWTADGETWQDNSARQIRW